MSELSGNMYFASSRKEAQDGYRRFYRTASLGNFELIVTVDGQVSVFWVAHGYMTAELDSLKKIAARELSARLHKKVLLPN